MTVDDAMCLVLAWGYGLVAVAPFLGPNSGALRLLAAVSSVILLAVALGNMAH